MKCLTRSLIVILGIAAGALLAGCTTSDDKLGSVFIAPGKYRLYNCPELIQRQAEIVGRLKLLEGLMAKAGQDAGGRVASAMAYRSEYLSMRGDLVELRREAVEKECRLPDPNAAPAPAAPPKPAGRTKPR